MTTNLFKDALVSLAATLVALACLAAAPAAAQAGRSPAAVLLDQQVDVALKDLARRAPISVDLARHAKGVLVFPEIVKGGLILGGQYGKGALRRHGRTVGYFETVAASYGLQAGVQKYGYAMFFMTDAALTYLDSSGGWEVGVGPSVVIMDADQAMAKSFSSTTMREDVYVFFFNQSGLMAGLGMQGSKINRIEP
jgi:lipid-binding SYLF domain-containing protein